MQVDQPQKQLANSVETGGLGGELVRTPQQSKD